MSCLKEVSMKDIIKIIANVLAIDETSDWHLDAHLERAIERIETVWFFDSNEETHVCSLSPSFLLYPLYTYAIFKPAFEYDEEVRAETDRIIQNNVDNEPRYFDCSYIKRLITDVENKKEQFKYRKVDYKFETSLYEGDYNQIYRQIIQDLIETYQRNHVL